MELALHQASRLVDKFQLFGLIVDFLILTMEELVLSRKLLPLQHRDVRRNEAVTRVSDGGHTIWNAAVGSSKMANRSHRKCLASYHSRQLDPIMSGRGSRRAVFLQGRVSSFGMVSLP